MSKLSQSPLQEGRKVLIRTVTHYQTGTVVAVDEHEVLLADSAWIGDTGRWSKALAEGVLSEVEPTPEGDIVSVARGAIVDVYPWRHDLPRTLK